MKVISLILFIGVCLAAVNASVQLDSAQSVEIDIEDLSLDSSDEFGLEIETFGLKSVIKTALRSLKGINCSIKAALIMKAAAEQGIQDLQDCGDQLSSQVKKLIKVLNNIVSICNDIIHLNENICHASDDDDGKSSSKCFSKMVRKFLSLYKNINKALKMIKNIPTTGSKANECVTDAVTKVSDTFTQFPSYITECSKLTSN